MKVRPDIPTIVFDQNLNLNRSLMHGRYTISLVNTMQRSCGYIGEEAQNHDLVDEGRTKETQLMPAPSRGDSRVGKCYHSTPTMESANKLEVFHDGHGAEPAHLVEHPLFQKEPLIAIWHLENGGSEVREPFDQAHQWP